MMVVFRVDASAKMGIGHLMRCLTLAEGLRSRGKEVRFICRAQPGNLIGLLKRRAMPVTVLPDAPEARSQGESDYAAWLGVSQAQDASQTIEALAGRRPDWLIVDHYGLDAKWEQQLRPHVQHLMVIDDLADRPHDCDLLLDQNFAIEPEMRYRDLVPAACRLLLGPRYALLRREYRLWRQTLRPRDGRVRRVLVFLGGADPGHATSLALTALSTPELRHLHVDVVVGGNNPHRSALEAQARSRPRTTLHGHRPHLADLMAQADLAVGAGGVTTWERLCLGLPSLVISIAENQKPACVALAEAGVIYYAGDVGSLDEGKLSEHLCRILKDPKELVRMSEEGELMVDGWGVQRVVEALDPTPVGEIRLRPAEEEDIVLYYDWAGEHGARREGRHRDLLLWEQHKRWFQEKLDDPCSRLFVVEANGLPLGQIRFDRDQEEVRVDYSLDPLAHGRGWAAHLVALGARRLNELEPIYLGGEGDPGSAASRAAFLRLFSPELDVEESYTRFSIVILSDRSSWLNTYLPELVLDWLRDGHRVLWTHTQSELRPADLCFYLGCSRIVPAEVLGRFRNNLVVHESNLPQGKGWSPLTWQILEGKNRIPVTLLEADKKVDSGVVYMQEWVEFEGHELIGELRDAVARVTLSLCRRFVEAYPAIVAQAREQVGKESFYRRRRPADSRLEPMRSLADQFDLLRVVDNVRYPAFFEWRGHSYVLSIRKAERR